MTVDHLDGRDHVLGALREEVMGPAPYGEEIDVSKTVEFASMEKTYGPYVEVGTGEEILCWDRPVTRYGVGVLFPVGVGGWRELEQQSTDEDVEEEAAARGEAAMDELVSGAAEKTLDGIGRKSVRSGQESDPELDLSAANALRQASLGVTFLCTMPETGRFRLTAAGGRYERFEVRVSGRKEPRYWFVRRPWSATAMFEGNVVNADRPTRLVEVFEGEAFGPLRLSAELYVRPRGDGSALVTATLVNRSGGGRGDDELAAFQARFSVSVVMADETVDAIKPYPRPDLTMLDEEERTFELLYRKQQTFAIGHGCAAEWDASEGAAAASVVSAEPLPVIDTPSITSDLVREDKTPFAASMAALGGLVADDDGLHDLRELIALYGKWIDDRRAEVALLPTEFHPTAKGRIALLELTRDRIAEGLTLIETDSVVARAFRLANQAVLLQQLRTFREARLVVGTVKGQGRLKYSSAAAVVDPLAPPAGRGSWYAFQIAFIVMTLPSIADGTAADRDTAELIWFPTGGGKTEAYLGLSAFAMFLRRLRDPADTGTSVLMRYTLRLLTAQQFQRATALLCAMESIRRGETDLGAEEFTIGIWLGSSMTPNTRTGARAALARLRRDAKSDNPFLVSRCPWCAAQIGPLRGVKGAPKIVGYLQAGESVRIACSDPDCAFARGLPIAVVDEDMYEHPPSLVIGTVDKFALLAWRPDARAFFGLDASGDRASSPPELIIQDELHLITGPLGSMVGLYEMVIEDLCTDRRNGGVVKPKLITSTATIRRFTEQALALYGRTQVSLFPPPGLEAGDSFFGRYARGADDRLLPGRRYVGIHAANDMSLITTQVIATAALLQAPMHMSAEARDPWWTLMVFFNSLRELGTSLSLLQANVPIRLQAIGNRSGIGRRDLRLIRRPMELTSRLRNDDVPKAIEELEISTTSSQGDPVDVCLASNIIEVGIDVDRLSLMVVVGQPKTTSQYIQVTGRIGRRWRDRPGLVVTLLNSKRPRDRSHYEHFRTSHERLYAEVEPTSVTPFSPSALDRALHGAMVAFVRQYGPRSIGPHPVPIELIERFEELALERVRTIDPEEEQALVRVLDRRVREWKAWQRTEWQKAFGEDDPGLIVAAGDDVSHQFDRYTWPTPMSMRSVDAECEASITMAYATADLQTSGAGGDNDD